MHAKTQADNFVLRLKFTAGGISICVCRKTATLTEWKKHPHKVKQSIILNLCSKIRREITEQNPQSKLTKIYMFTTGKKKNRNGTILKDNIVPAPLLHHS